MAWRFAEASRIGGRAEQQDRAEVFSADGAHLAVIADGMGGHESGAAAAQAVIDIARESFVASNPAEPRDFLEEICFAAHEAIRTLPNSEGPSAGSTCVLFYANGPEAYWIHVGDTRLYHFENGRLLGRTHDHSLVQFMLDQNEIQEEEAVEHPLKNQIYMRLGGDNQPEPSFDCRALEDRATFLLCTDGFWETVEPEEAAAMLAHADSLEDAVQALVDRANERGGSDADNISVIVARWTETTRSRASTTIADGHGSEPPGGWKRIIQRAKAAFGE
jgi:serine/threonine protein phosphatase PrpC